MGGSSVRGLRYLHLKSFLISDGADIQRGRKIADIRTIQESSKDPACYLSTTDGPHLHLDLMKSKGTTLGKTDFTDFSGHYIGGWLVNDGLQPYNGTLSNGAAEVSPNTDHSSIMNLGLVGNEKLPDNNAKFQDNVKLCPNNFCLTAPQGSVVHPKTELGWVSKVLFWIGNKIEFFFGSTVESSKAGSTQEIYSCLNSDVSNLQDLYFPDGITSLLNATRVVVSAGDCNLQDRPVLKGGLPNNPNTGGSTSNGPVNYGCSNQNSGIKFTDSKNNCFYMPGSGNASLPFSPTSIQVLDANRKYDMHLCNGNDVCDEFNNSGSIDYSSVSRPFVRAEVSVQGLVSDSTVASCEVRTGRKVEFGTLTLGTQYYTDRKYTVKTVSKAELVGLRFVKTPNDDKGNGDPEYLVCNIKKNVEIIIGVDGRATRIPGWIKDKYTRMNEEVGVTDNDMQHFDLYKCNQKGGFQLRLGGPVSPISANIKSNYIVIFRDVGDNGLQDCSAKFNVAPDAPTLNQLANTNLLSAPMLSWQMTDRNIHDDFLQAKVNVWKNGQLLGQDLNLWQPVGVTQWVPLWSEPGDYTAEVVVHDSRGLEAKSNQVAYTIHEQTPAPTTTVVSNLIIQAISSPSEQNQSFNALVQNVNGQGQITVTVHYYEKPGLFNRFSQVAVPLNGSEPTTVTLTLNHFYDDFELVVDPDNKFLETDEGDNRLYVDSKFAVAPLESGVYAGDIVGVAQNGKVLFEPSGISSQGMLTYISATYMQKCMQDLEMAQVLKSSDPNSAFTQYFATKGNLFGGTIHANDVISPSGFL